MFNLLLSADYAPFTIAFVIMVGIGLIEAAGLGLGQFDLHPGVEADMDGGLLDWLGLGSGLPILIWLTSLLGCFAIVGLALQQASAGLGSGPLPWPAAAAAALLLGGLLNMAASRGLARIMPGFESSAIQPDDLMMRRGIILEGVARRGHPARAKVVDQHHQAHYVMVEPHHDHEVIAQGETAMLVRKEGAIFFALLDQPPTLRPI